MPPHRNAHNTIDNASGPSTGSGGRRPSSTALMLSSGAAKPSTAGVNVASNPRACARNSCHHSGSISVSDSATGGCDASDACSREPSATANGSAVSMVIRVTATISRGARSTADTP